MSESDCHLENPGFRRCKPKFEKLPQIALLLILVGSSCLDFFLWFWIVLVLLKLVYMRKTFVSDVCIMSLGMHKLWVTMIFPLAMLWVKDELVMECHWWLYLPIILKCWFCKFRSWRTVKLYAETVRELKFMISIFIFVGISEIYFKKGIKR